MMVRNTAISTATWVVAIVSYGISLIAWAFGRYNGPKRTFKVLFWLEGERLSKCIQCGFRVMHKWNFCPECGHDAKEAFLQELEGLLDFD